MQDINTLLDQLSASSTRIAKDLRPAVLDFGVAAAIQWLLREFSQRYGIQTELEGGDLEPTLEDYVATAVFRVVQEALTNIAKHAQAKKVSITIFQDARELTIEVRDDGRGLTGQIRQGAWGIIGMRERIQALGGWLEVASPAGEGVTVMFGLPRRRAGATKGRAL